MNITLTLGETCMLLIVIALFILLLYCISLIRHMIPSVKSLQKVMKDVEVITEAAANSTKSAEVIVGDVMDVTSSLVSNVKGPVGLMGQATSIASAVKIVMDLIKGNGNEEEDSSDGIEVKSVDTARDDEDHQMDEMDEE